jgi:hypothetical protein
VLTEIEALSTVQKSGEANVRSFGKFKDNHEETIFFGREREKVLDDVSYALAKTRELMGSTSSSKSLEKIQSADEEMRRLQEQLRLLGQ